MLKRTVPILHASDIERTTTFLAEQLGFQVARPMPDYLVAERDQAEIHYRLSTIAPAQGTGCYVVADDVQPLYAELRCSGLPVEPPAAQPWGLTELTVIDPDGNTLRFASASSGDGSPSIVSASVSLSGL